MKRVKASARCHCLGCRQGYGADITFGASTAFLCSLLPTGATSQPVTVRRSVVSQIQDDAAGVVHQLTKVE